MKNTTINEKLDRVKKFASRNRYELTAFALATGLTVAAATFAKGTILIVNKENQNLLDSGDCVRYMIKNEQYLLIKETITTA